LTKLSSQQPAALDFSGAAVKLSKIRSNIMRRVFARVDLGVDDCMHKADNLTFVLG